MIRPAVFPLVALTLAIVCQPAASARPIAAGTSPPSNAALAPIADVVDEEIASGRIPGAVILIGQGDEILFRRAFGLRSRTPVAAPMTIDTIFDLASLTKVVATTTAVMQLAERGALDLQAPVSKYWPAFGGMGKQRIAVHDLLTHYSGLKPDLNLSVRWTGYEAAMARLAAERPAFAPGERYLYSDENFTVLGELVRRVTGLPLDEYCARHLFEPLHMRDTGFRPPAEVADRVAPTGRQSSAGPAIVHDPTAVRMRGVAGHAGLFSTADDLATFARMLLHGGMLGDARVLESRSVMEMTQPQSPPSGTRRRGLGWDLMAATEQAELSTVGSFGHTGYTGTMIWIDPASGIYVIVLANRTHPDGRGDAQPLRRRILDLVSHT